MNTADRKILSFTGLLICVSATGFAVEIVTPPRDKDELEAYADEVEEQSELSESVGAPTAARRAWEESAQYWEEQADDAETGV